MYQRQSADHTNVIEQSQSAISQQEKQTTELFVTRREQQQVILDPHHLTRHPLMAAYAHCRNTSASLLKRSAPVAQPVKAHKRLHMPLQAVSKAEAGVTEAEKRLMQLQKDKEELDRQLQQTQKAVLAGKQKVEKLREEIQRRTEARTVSTAPVKSCAYDRNMPLASGAVQMDARLL